VPRIGFERVRYGQASKDDELLCMKIGPGYDAAIALEHPGLNRRNSVRFFGFE
jgi:hypothetical protein